MPRKKKEQDEEGAPAWMVTYGDMMTLLLCFFVIIVALSEIKEDERYRAVVESLQEAFGYRGGVGTAPTETPPTCRPGNGNWPSWPRISGCTWASRPTKPRMAGTPR